MTEQRLIVLPNKDLWRGSVRVEPVDKVEDTTVGVEVVFSPLDKAIRDIITSAKGGPLNCLWCGQQFKEVELTDHLTKNHPSVVNPMSHAQVALHQVAVAEAAVEAATAQE